MPRLMREERLVKLRGWLSCNCNKPQSVSRRHVHRMLLAKLLGSLRRTPGTAQSTKPSRLDGQRDCSRCPSDVAAPHREVAPGHHAVEDVHGEAQPWRPCVALALNIAL